MDPVHTHANYPACEGLVDLSAPKMNQKQKQCHKFCSILASVTHIELLLFNVLNSPLN